MRVKRNQANLYETIKKNLKISESSNKIIEKEKQKDREEIREIFNSADNVMNLRN